MHARERKYAYRDDDARHVRPFEWGTEFLDPVEGDADGDPRAALAAHAERALRRSDEFFAPPEIHDYQLHGEGNSLTWTSGVVTPTAENNVARAQYFPAATKRRRAAVVVLPQWNADSQSHVALCRLLNRFRMSALRLTLPYHAHRRPAEMGRAEHLVSSNIGRTIQSMRQAVIDARSAVRWLKGRGYERIGVLGTSIGSCAAFLAFVHEEMIDVGVYNHVSSYFADVVWRGISTRHVRAGFGDQVSLDELRRYWLPISPYPYASRLLSVRPDRPLRFISARYDLTFLPDLSRHVIAEVERLRIPLDVAWLPCGHYTLGETPWKYLDGWKIMSFFRRHL